MSKHSQNGPREPIAPFVCTRCQGRDCNNCVDVLRSIYTDIMICKCKLADHSGEPNKLQVSDPFTGDVITPGLTVTKDGEVKRNG